MKIDSPVRFAVRIRRECVYGPRWEEQYEPSTAIPLIAARDEAIREQLAIETAELRAEVARLKEDLRCSLQRNVELDDECERLAERLDEAEQESKALKLDWPE